MRRGEIYLANLNPRSGSEQKGKRPVIIVSHDSFNQAINWRSIIAVPVSTSENQANRSLTVVLIPKDTGGLDKNSVALCHQVTTLDKEKITSYLGTLPIEIFSKIEEGLKAALDLSESE